ncbi:hypothetical protein B0H17DRAFT_1194141 [Mycena rosella]|uniref:Uncharacterized protein n=1 Tax=Mycena rosella TaxID=1033263 RepID=A0AAD7E1B3_MYCRO|nr:hypothetical protein B0H17DRAFT_1194141 [Mycena rosella]
MYEDDYGGNQQLYNFKDYVRTAQTRLEPELDPSLLATLHETPSQSPGRVQHMNSALHEPLGLGHPPKTRPGRSVLLNPSMPAAGHGFSSRVPSLQFPRGPAPELARAPAPDIGSLFAAMSLQQSKILNQNQKFLEANAALQARVASVESRQSSHPTHDPSLSDHSDPRLAAVVQKKAKAKQARKERHQDALQGQAPLSVDSGLLRPSLGDKDISPEVAEAKTATQLFRDVCGVRAKDAWPNPDVIRSNEITGERYLTPRFDHPITDPVNQHSVSTVAQQAYDDLQKVDQKNSVVKAFAAEHGLDPKVLSALLNESHESDEASGPEDNSGESREVWKARMATVAEIPVTSHAMFEKLEFLEVLEPDCARTSCHESLQIHPCGGTGRSLQRIPDVSPWDFGIAMPWLQIHRLLPENSVLLAGWATYGNPPGFDAFDRSFFGTFHTNDTGIETSNIDEMHIRKARYHRMVIRKRVRIRVELPGFDTELGAGKA